MISVDNTNIFIKINIYFHNIIYLNSYLKYKIKNMLIDYIIT